MNKYNCTLYQILVDNPENELNEVYAECLKFCETQWRHSVKTGLYKNPPPYFIVLASSV